ncbi:hypothetical protein [Kaistella polysaccharea]|uniref:hypothetical protein n=1 Tax=Kaistella polysaccharea TaxID=2878534 RepID=UPI001CF31743|nr:hypothetical protein [Kaistella polysaccharea]
MAQKLKSQDLMELFNAKLDVAIEKFDMNEKIITTVNKKLEEINNSSLKVDYEPLGTVVQENDKMFKEHRSELLNLFEKQISTMKVVAKEKEKYQLYFYGALTILLFLCTGFLSYGIDQYHKKEDAERKLKFYARESYRMNTYLKEKNLTEKYENWLESKQK